MAAAETQSKEEGSPTKKARIEGSEVLKVSNPEPRKDQVMLGVSGFGCLYKEVEEEQCRACVDKALELGVRYFDTAPWYGAGLSETRLGTILADRWDGLRVSTKCGRVIKHKDAITDKDHEEKGYLGGEGLSGQFFTEKFHSNRPCWDYSGDGIRESFRQSLERLRLKRVNCIRLHDCESEERFKQFTEEGGMDAMIELKKSGKVDELSLGFNDSDYILRILKKYPNVIDNVMLAGCFNLIDNDSVDLLLECQRQNVKITNVGIFASGILWGGAHYKYGGVPQEVQDKVSKWTALAEKHGLTLPQVAFNFAFLPDVVDYVAVGTCRAAGVVQNLELAGRRVPAELWREAQSQGLIAAGVPLPA